MYGTDYLNESIRPDSKVLVVDDVFDSGLTLQEVIKKIKKDSALSEDSGGYIKTVTVYYKPVRNQTALTPDYYVHKTDDWIVFPSEFVGLTRNEILANKGADLGKYF